MGDREKDNTTMNKETPYDPNREKTSTYQYLIEFLKESSGIYLAHHDDADGLTSVAFFLKLYASIKGKPLDDINNSVQLLPINNGPRSFDNQQMEELKTAPDNNIVLALAQIKV